MTFTESVIVLDDGFRLVDSVGATVPTAEPVARRAHGQLADARGPARRPVHRDLEAGVLGRAPVAGAFSFGVGTSRRQRPRDHLPG
jgi:hypothetical protein